MDQVSFLGKKRRGNGRLANGLAPPKEQTMADKDRDPAVPEVGKQVLPRRHDAGSGANETADGLDATTEELRHAAEDTPSGDGPGKIEKTPVFDRADLSRKI
jgi:hypothetical protein